MESSEGEIESDQEWFIKSVRPAVELFYKNCKANENKRRRMGDPVSAVAIKFRYYLISLSSIMSDT